MTSVLLPGQRVQLLAISPLYLMYKIWILAAILGDDGMSDDAN